MRPFDLTPARAFASYNESQFTPVKPEGAAESTLITANASAGGGRYLDPRAGHTFAFDHLRKEASAVRGGRAPGGRWPRR